MRVGLTGGFASGKSTVGEMFVALGAKLLQTDRLAHQLMRAGEPVYLEIVRTFGEDILNPDKSINRSRLAEVAFGTTGSATNIPRIQELNKIIHPPVIQLQREWLSAMERDDPGGVAIVEAALIFEAGLVGDFERIIVVTCEARQRIQRCARRMNIDLAAAEREVARRMASQIPEEEKIKAADYVIDDSGSLEHSGEQVHSVFATLQSTKEI